MICNFHSCSICQCEENEIPLPWKQESQHDDIDKNIDEQFHKWVEKYNYSSPMWIVENEIDSKNGIYVNLIKNPEAFTGYQGQHIWNAIYFENCFNNEVKSPELMCKEEKTLYKIISGLHANINIHLSRNYLDIDRNLTYFNTSMLIERVINHPERINNMFFLYSLLLKSFYKAEKFIIDYNYYTGNNEEDKLIPEYVVNAYNKTEIDGNVLCEECLRRDLSASEDSENFDNFFDFNPLKIDQLKTRFRNISQIIDCVSCQKCKLHGKLQIYGLATMLKILFTKNPEHDLTLKRNELISFVNLVGKVSKSINHLYEYLKTNRFRTSKKTSDGNLIYTIFFTASMWVLVIMNVYFYKSYGNRKKKNNNSYSKINTDNTETDYSTENIKKNN